MENKMNVNKNKNLSVDEAIIEAGEFGKYQIILLLLLSSAFFITSIPVLTMYFAAHNPPWRCIANTSCTLNSTYSRGSKHYEARCRLQRNEWEYAMPLEYSLVTQFDLSCDKEWMVNLLKSIIFVGWAFGAIICGAFNDRFGRKKILIISSLTIFISSLGMVFSNNVWLVVVLQAIRGFFRPGASVSAYVLASEAVRHRYRPRAGISLLIGTTMAGIFLGLIAYLIQEWRKLILVCTLPYLPIIVAIFFVPESIRWLRVRGRESDAITVLKKMARINGKTLGQFKLEKLSTVNTETSYLDLVRPRRVLLRTIIQWLAWCFISLVFYGMTFAADNLGGNVYRDYILTRSVEFPAIFAAIYTSSRFGRKPSVSCPMFVAALAIVIIAFIPEESEVKWLRIVFGMIGRLSISMAFGVMYTWSVELYPTSIRSKGMGAVQVAGRVGSIASPWIAKSLRVYHVAIPFLVMGVSGLVTGIILLWLPETKGKKTLEDIGDEISDYSVKEDVRLSLNGKGESEDRTQDNGKLIP